MSKLNYNLENKIGAIIGANSGIGKAACLQLAKRLKGMGVIVNCVRIGNAAIPDMRLDHLPALLVKLYNAKRKFVMTPEKMAETYVWLAADPAYQELTGGYWDTPDTSGQANNNPIIVRPNNGYGTLPGT